MPTYVIHIGPPKAGSKFLQSSLREWRYKLRDHGVHYRSTLANPSPHINHEWMTTALKTIPNARIEEAFERLNKSDYRYVVLSSEGFFGLSTRTLEYIKHLASGSPIQIVYYCRRWSERIPSQWKQLVKMGSYATFIEHYVGELRDPGKFLDLNPKLVWDKFAGVFGRHSLRLISFNGLVESKLDLCDHFLEHILQVPRMPRAERLDANESPDMIESEVIRAMNYLQFKQTGVISEAMRVAFTNLADRQVVEDLKKIMTGDLGTIVLNDEIGPFKSIYNQMMQYQDCLVALQPQQQQQDFFRPQALRLGYVQQNYLLHEHAVGLLQRLHERLTVEAPVPAHEAVSAV